MPRAPGYFIAATTNMNHTESVLVELPIHPKSSVTMIRHVPNIPGVPDEATTVPPLITDPRVIESLPPPKSEFEYLERVGKISYLPFGYSHHPWRRCGMLRRNPRLAQVGWDR